ncbi:hypothetical protein LCGC14_1908570 [marine sediment metagenome]|uniref:Uncharacterized protein n=1 Tax=marine sediment metagenome TaxID=412755 RepID=A0A0F9FUC8_9ZZZZ
MSKYKFFKVKIEVDLIVQCKSEEEILSMVYHDLYENMEILIKIKEKKEISEEEAYEN